MMAHDVHDTVVGSHWCCIRNGIIIIIIIMVVIIIIHGVATLAGVCNKQHSVHRHDATHFADGKRQCRTMPPLQQVLPQHLQLQIVAKHHHLLTAVADSAGVGRKHRRGKALTHGRHQRRKQRGLGQHPCVAGVPWPRHEHNPCVFLHGGGGCRGVVAMDGRVLGCVAMACKACNNNGNNNDLKTATMRDSSCAHANLEVGIAPQ